MARRILNRKEMRADYDAAERRKEDEEADETEEEVEDEEEDEAEDEAEDEGEDEEGDEEGDEGDEDEAPKKKKKKKVAAPKAKAKPRSRAAKVVRMKVIWGVYDNSNRRVAVYEYPRRAEADAHAKKLTEDKKSTHFVQPEKVPMEEKKE